MPKANPFLHHRPKRPTLTRTFTDENAPGLVVTLSLRAMDAPGGHVAVDKEAEFVEKYITGGRDERGEPFPAMDFPAMDGESVPISRTLCRNVANLVAAQSPVKEDGSENDEIYNFEEFVGFSVTMPDAWPQFLHFAKEAEAESRALKKSVLAGNGAITSDSPSSITSGTSNSTNGKTPSLSVLTPVLVSSALPSEIGMDGILKTQE